MPDSTALSAEKVAQLRADYPGLFDSLQRDLTRDLGDMWRKGFGDGMEMAGRMVEALQYHHETSDEQRAVLGGLESALRQARDEFTATNGQAHA